MYLIDFFISHQFLTLIYSFDCIFCTRILTNITRYLASYWLKLFHCLGDDFLLLTFHTLRCLLNVLTRQYVRTFILKLFVEDLINPSPLNSLEQSWFIVSYRFSCLFEFLQGLHDYITQWLVRFRPYLLSLCGILKVK